MERLKLDSSEVCSAPGYKLERVYTYSFNININTSNIDSHL